jgi:hypothetical protein
VAQAQGVPEVRIRVLRPFEEPFGRMVRDVDLRQPDEEPHVPATTGSGPPSPDLEDLIRGTSERSLVDRRYSHSIVPGGLLVMS